MGATFGCDGRENLAVVRQLHVRMSPAGDERKLTGAVGCLTQSMSLRERNA